MRSPPDMHVISVDEMECLAFFTPANKSLPFSRSRMGGSLGPLQNILSEASAKETALGPVLMVKLPKTAPYIKVRIASSERKHLASNLCSDGFLFQN